MTFDGFISYSHAADGRLAPAVQQGLHRLAKPWHHRRALWIFRDQTGLSVTPALWSSIQQALDGSEWFVLLASPEAAQSPWVNREIEHWITTKPANRILPVVTDGKWEWDAERGDLAADATAVPDALRGVFTEEPLFLDLRWARDDSHLGLQHDRFRDAIAQLAAPMHGLSKDELEGEDVRQHRRVRWVRRVAVATVLLLTMVASLTGVLAQHNADRATASAVDARRQHQVAAEQRDNAERAAAEAQRQEQNARTHEAQARAATTETKLQERRAREQQDLAEQAAAEVERQLKNADRQQKIAKRAQALADEQKALAREQSELAQQSAQETTSQKKIAEQQQRLAAEAAAEAERQKDIARQQQGMAQDAAAEARRQEAIARENERKAKAAAEEARRQEKNAAAQKQLTLSRRLLNQAKATISNDPVTALRLGVAAQKIQPSTESRAELTGLVTSTRRLGGLSDAETVAYGPNNILAVIESDFSASLWNVANPAEPVRLAPLFGIHFRGQPVFSPDGKTLAILDGGRGSQPILFDVSDPAHPAMITAVPAAGTNSVTFSPDGKTLAGVFVGGGWTLWDVADRRNPALLSYQPNGYPAPVVFSPDGHTLVTAGDPGIVWDITDRTHPAEIGTLDGYWQLAAFNPIRPLVATTNGDGNLTFWNMEDPAQPQRLSTVPTGGTRSVSFSRDGLTLATDDTDGSARLWDMTEDKPVHLADVSDHTNSAVSLEFSPDSRTLATTGFSGTLSLWTVAAHGAPKIVGRAVGAPRYGLTAALTPDARRLTTTNSDGTATVWDMSDRTRPVERATVRVDPSNMETARVSPDGNTIAVLGWTVRGSVTLFDLSDPGKPVELGALPGGPYGHPLAFAPDGQTLAVEQNYGVTLWNLADRRHPTLLATLPGTDDLVFEAAFSRDGHTLAVATDRTVDLWRLTDPTHPDHLGALQGHGSGVGALAFSPDGRTLATGSADKTAALWNVADKTPWRRLAIMTGNDAPVVSVAFSPDGRTLATGTGSGAAVDPDAAKLWDVTDPSGPVRVATMTGTDVQSTSLLFHPDSRTLTTSGTKLRSTRAVVWDYSALNDLRADPAARACAVTGGGLTREEWAAYIPEVPYQATCG